MKNIINQMVLTDKFRRVYLTAEYTFSLSTHGTFSRMDYMLEHKTSHRFKQIENIPSIFSDHNGMKLKNQEEKWKICEHMEIKQHFPEQSIHQIRN